MHTLTLTENIVPLCDYSSKSVSFADDTQFKYTGASACSSLFDAHMLSVFWPDFIIIRVGFLWHYLHSHACMDAHTHTNKHEHEPMHIVRTKL